MTLMEGKARSVCGCMVIVVHLGSVTVGVKKGKAVLVGGMCQLCTCNETHVIVMCVGIKCLGIKYWL